MNLYDAFVYGNGLLINFTKEADIITQTIDGCLFEFYETGINSRKFECSFNPNEKRAAVRTLDGDDRIYLMYIDGKGLRKKIKYYKINSLNRIKPINTISTLIDNRDLKLTVQELVNLSLDEIEEYLHG